MAVSHPDATLSMPATYTTPVDATGAKGSSTKRPTLILSQQSNTTEGYSEGPLSASLDPHRRRSEDR